METAKLAVSVLAVVLALASFVVAQRSAAKARRAEEVRSLLGDKSDVAFGALKMLRDGLPANQDQRQLVIAALMQACVFEASDRARALLYRVIEIHRDSHGVEFRQAFNHMNENFTAMEKYGFPKERLDLDRGRRRIETVAVVLNSQPKDDMASGRSVS